MKVRVVLGAIVLPSVGEVAGYYGSLEEEYYATNFSADSIHATRLLLRTTQVSTDPRGREDNS